MSESEPLHAQLVQLVAATPDVHTTGWRKALRRFIDAHQLISSPEAIEIPNRIPDAYRIVGDDIDVWEIEVGGPLSAERLREWALLWADLDAETDAIQLRLHVLDRYGHCQEANLTLLWYARLHRREW